MQNDIRTNVCQCFIDTLVTGGNCFSWVRSCQFSRIKSTGQIWRQHRHCSNTSFPPVDVFSPVQARGCHHLGQRANPSQSHALCQRWVRLSPAVASSGTGDRILPMVNFHNLRPPGCSRRDDACKAFTNCWLQSEYQDSAKGACWCTARWCTARELQNGRRVLNNPCV